MLCHIHPKNIHRLGFCIYLKILTLYVWGQFYQSFWQSHTSPVHFISGMIACGWSVVLLTQNTFEIGNLYTIMDTASGPFGWAVMTGIVGTLQMLHAVWIGLDICARCRPALSAVAMVMWGSVAYTACTAVPVSTAAAAYGALSIALAWTLFREVIWKPLSKR